MADEALKSKKESKKFHLFEDNGIKYGMYKNGQPYLPNERTASEMQDWYRKKMGLKEGAKISLSGFKKALARAFKIKIEKAGETASDRDKEFMKRETEPLPEK